MASIQQIMSDPRYREFAAACTERGKQVEPDAHPWKLMGLTDEQIRAADLRYESDKPMPAEDIALLIRVIRAVESQVVVWWDSWKSWEYLAAGKSLKQEVADLRADAVQELNPCRPGAQGTLF